MALAVEQHLNITRRLHALAVRLHIGALRRLVAHKQAVTNNAIREHDEALHGCVAARTEAENKRIAVTKASFDEVVAKRKAADEAAALGGEL